MKFNNILGFFSICILWSACNIINPLEKVPTYIHIDSFKFVNTEPGRTGGYSHDINAVWVTYNGELVGVYDLPATFPILATGNAKLTLGPAITINGMNNFKSVYPFYTYDTSTLSQNPGKTITYLPQTSYYGALADTFRYLENFETGTTLDTFYSDSTIQFVPIVRTTSPDSVYEGTGSGAIRLNSASDSSLIIFNKPSPAIYLPGGPVFCEFNYKGNLNLAIGVLPIIPGYSTQIKYYYFFSPSDKWQKIYVSLGNIISQYTIGTYALYFKTSLPDGQNAGYELIDNVKIISSR